MPDPTPTPPAPAPAPAEGTPPVPTPPAPVPGITPPAPSPIPSPPPVPPAPPAPAAWDPKVPTQLPPGFDAAAAVQTIKELKGISGETAQELLDRSIKQHEAFTSGEQKRLEGWDASVKADPRLGGPNYEKTQTLVARGAQVAGGQELVAFLSSTGLNRHPLIVKAFAAVGEHVKEDSIGGGNPAPAGIPSGDDKLRYDYPSMYNSDGTPKY